MAKVMPVEVIPGPYHDTLSFLSSASHSTTMMLSVLEFGAKRLQVGPSESKGKCLSPL